MILFLDIDGATLELSIIVDSGPGVRREEIVELVGVEVTDLARFHASYGTNLDPRDYFDVHTDALQAIGEAACAEERRCYLDD